MTFSKKNFIQWLKNNNLGDLIPYTRSGNTKSIGNDKSAVNLMYLKTDSLYSSIDKIKDLLESYFSNIDQINYYGQSPINVLDLHLEIQHPLMGTLVFYNPNYSSGQVYSRTSNVYSTILLKGSTTQSLLNDDSDINLFGFIIQDVNSNRGTVGDNRIYQEAIVALLINHINLGITDFNSLCTASGFDLNTTEIVKKELLDYLDDNELILSEQDKSESQYFNQAQTVVSDLSDRYVNLKIYQAIYNSDLTDNIKSEGVARIWESTDNISTRRDKYCTADIWLIMHQTYEKIKDLTKIDIDRLTATINGLPQIIGLSLKKENTLSRGSATEFIKDKAGIFNTGYIADFEYTFKDGFRCFTTKESFDKLDYVVDLIQKLPSDRMEQSDELDAKLDSLTELIEALVNKLNYTIDTNSQEGLHYKARFTNSINDDKARAYKQTFTSKYNVILTLIRLLNYMSDPDNSPGSNELKDRPDMKYFLDLFNFGSGNLKIGSDLDLMIPTYLCHPAGNNNSFKIEKLSEYNAYKSRYKVYPDKQKDCILVDIKPYIQTSYIRNIPINFINSVSYFNSRIEYIGNRTPMLIKDQK